MTVYSYANLNGYCRSFLAKYKCKCSLQTITDYDWPELLKREAYFSFRVEEIPLRRKLVSPFGVPHSTLLIQSTTSLNYFIEEFLI